LRPVGQSSEADLSEQFHAGAGELGEIAFHHAVLNHRRAGMQLDAARSKVRVSALRGDRHRLEADDVARPAGRMDLASRDHRGDAAVEAAVDPVELLLARGVVADDRVDMAVDQAGAEGDALGVDDGRGPGGIKVLLVSHGGNPVAFADDAVAVDQRLLDPAREDLADVADDEFRLAGGGVGHG